MLTVFRRPIIHKHKDSEKKTITDYMNTIHIETHDICPWFPPILAYPNQQEISAVKKKKRKDSFIDPLLPCHPFLVLLTHEDLRKTALVVLNLSDKLLEPR